MCLKPGESIGKKIHPNIDQFFRIEQDVGKVVFALMLNHAKKTLILYTLTMSEKYAAFLTQTEQTLIDKQNPIKPKKTPESQLVTKSSEPISTIMHTDEEAGIIEGGIKLDTLTDFLQKKREELEIFLSDEELIDLMLTIGESDEESLQAVLLITEDSEEIKKIESPREAVKLYENWVVERNRKLETKLETKSISQWSQVIRANAATRTLVKNEYLETLAKSMQDSPGMYELTYKEIQQMAMFQLAVEAHVLDMGRKKSDLMNIQARAGVIGALTEELVSQRDGTGEKLKDLKKLLPKLTAYEHAASQIERGIKSETKGIILIEKSIASVRYPGKITAKHTEPKQDAEGVDYLIKCTPSDSKKSGVEICVDIKTTTGTHPETYTVTPDPHKKNGANIFQGHNEINNSVANVPKGFLKEIADKGKAYGICLRLPSNDDPKVFAPVTQDLSAFFSRVLY